MKIAIFICSLAIFATCLADDEQPPVNEVDEARNKAYEHSATFMTNYSNIMQDPDYNAVLTKSSDFQSNIPTKNEEANQQIRTPYDEYYTSLMLETAETGILTECYHITMLNLKVDVSRNFEYSYEIISVYSQHISQLQTLLSTVLSDKFYSVMDKFYTGLNVENVTVACIEAVIVQFDIDAANMLATSQKIIAAVSGQLDRLYTKFTDETEVRVISTLDKLNTTKQIHEECKSYPY